MGMARSTFYYQKTREENQKKKQKADADLVSEIQKIQLEAPVYVVFIELFCVVESE
jgi:hypothetical protein